jgi:hypothetical protein
MAKTPEDDRCLALLRGTPSRITTISAFGDFSTVLQALRSE